MNNYTYILSLSDGTYYIGYTTDLYRRLKEHNEGKGAKRTRGRRASLIFYAVSDSKTAAQSLEYRWKKLNRNEKERMIKEGNLTIL